MKKLLLVILACKICIFAQTQNLFPPSGNVGIGTQSPVGALSINLTNTDYTNTNGAGAHLMLSNPSSTGQNVFSSYINNNLVGKWRTDFEGNINWIAVNGYHAFYTGGDFPTGTAKMFISNAGSVGIGTTAPQSKLSVNGDLRLYDNQSNRATVGAAWGGANIGYGTGYLGFNLARNNLSDGNWTYFNDGANNGGQVIYGNIYGDLLFSNRSTTGSSSGTITDLDIVNNIKMKIQRDGKVVIGTNVLTTPGTYKLYVQDGILTERVKVALKTTTDWSDYVFMKNYKLLSLDQVEKFITTKHHLPNVLSAEQMVKEGNDLAKTDAKLLEKIEELTLYIIQINKTNQSLENRVKYLEQKLEKQNR